MTTATQPLTFESVTQASDPALRVQRFVELIASAQSRIEIADYCSKLYQWHYDRYSGKNGETGRVRSAIANLTLTRKAIEKIDIASLPEFAISEKNGKVRHYALDCLMQPEHHNPIKDQYDEDRAKGKRERMKASDALDLTQMIELATEMMQSTRSDEIALGLAVVTGRRGVEIALTGSFTQDGQYSFQFKGQAKSETKKNSFGLFPCLVDSATVEDAIDRLRELEPPAVFKLANYENPEKAYNDSALYGRMKRTFKTKFAPIFDAANFKGKENAHKLRGLYCVTIVQKHKEVKSEGDGQAWDYARKCLGHEKIDTTFEYEQLKVTNIPANFDLELEFDEVGFNAKAVAETAAPTPEKQPTAKVSADVVTLDQLYSKLDATTQNEITAALKDGETLVDIIAKALMQQTVSTEGKPRKNDAQTAIGDIVDTIMMYNAANEMKQLKITKPLVSRIFKRWKGKDISSQTYDVFLRSNQDKITAHHNSIVYSENNVGMRGSDMIEALDKIEEYLTSKV